MPECSRPSIFAPPSPCLRLRRLSRASAVLAAADPAVTTTTQVVMKFGILPPGRFAGDYWRIYGDTLSATLFF
ncbi:hypothetical protein WNZ15_08765 [Roseibium sp. AS2]|uniref:hypothetical protein n=1 Tax=Roseibium sp. AS2 TaxID=3135781 RepID=UPI00317C0B7F